MKEADSMEQTREQEMVRGQYERALAALVEKLQQDPYILAAVLVGSLSYDEVWQRSDIDLMLVTQEVKLLHKSFCLVEDGIDVHAGLVTRGEFRRMLEGSVQSSFHHSLLSKGRLLFSREESLAEMLAQRDALGERDRAVQFLCAASAAIYPLTKAEKWLVVKGDLDYCFAWILRCTDPLATLEALQHGEITGREVIQQAMRLNPAFFRTIYSDLIRDDKTPARLQDALNAVRGYLSDRIPLIFAPVLDYLAEADGPRSVTEINHHFSSYHNLTGMDTACEWLADQEVIRKIATPVRLTEKSRIDVQEAAYYYDRG